MYQYMELRSFIAVGEVSEAEERSRVALAAALDEAQVNQFSSL